MQFSQVFEADAVDLEQSLQQFRQAHTHDNGFQPPFITIEEAKKIVSRIETEILNSNYSNVINLLQLVQQMVAPKDCKLKCTENCKSCQTFLQTQLPTLLVEIFQKYNLQIGVTESLIKSTLQTVDYFSQHKEVCPRFGELFMIKLLDFIKRDDASPYLRKSCIQTLNPLLASRENIKFLKETTNLDREIETLAKFIYQAGDFLLQCLLTETIFRLIRKSKKKCDLKSVWKISSIVDHFNEISYKEFEGTLRKFLNHLNEHQKKICSFKTEIKINNHVEKDCWADFGTSSCSFALNNGLIICFDYSSVTAHDYHNSELKLKVPGLNLPTQFEDKASDTTLLSFKLTKASDEVKMSKINDVIKANVNKTSPVAKSNGSTASDLDIDTNGYRDNHADTLPRQNRTKKMTNAPKGSLTVPPRPPSSRYTTSSLDLEFDKLGTDFDTFQPKKLFSDRKRGFSSLDVDTDDYVKKPRIDDPLDSGDGEISKMLQELSSAIETKFKATSQKLVDSIQELQDRIEMTKHRHHDQRVELDSRFRSNLQKFDNQVLSQSSKLKSMYEDLKKELQILSNIKDMAVDFKKNVAVKLAELESEQHRDIDEIKREGDRKIAELKVFIDRHNQNKKHLADVVHKVSSEYNL